MSTLCYNYIGDNMYRKAIKYALNFTRPLATGKVLYKNKKLLNNISTLVLLNENGDILTSGKNAKLFNLAEEINEIYPNILEEIKHSKEKNIKKIEKKYGITDDTIVSLYNILIDVANNPGELKIITHPTLDLAIIKIEKNDGITTNKFPIFSTNKTEAGTSICNFGFAFPEYDAFEYDEEINAIKSNHKIMNFPAFPTEGIITRNIIDQDNNLTMFETSAIVVKGMQGGPVLDVDGKILGIMVDAKHIESLDKNYPFQLDLGLAINSTTIIEFLKENNIKYYEGK